MKYLQVLSILVGSAVATTNFWLSHSKNLTNIHYALDDGSSIFYSIHTDGDASDVLVTGDYGTFRETLVANSSSNDNPWIGWVNDKTGESSGFVYVGDVDSDYVEGDKVISVNGTISNGVVTRDYYDGGKFVKRHSDTDYLVRQKRADRCIGVRVGCGSWCLAIGKSIVDPEKTTSVASIEGGTLGFSS